MKTLETTLSKKTIKSCVLTGIILLQLGFSYQVVAQNIINSANRPHSNLGNVINVNNDPVQMAQIDNGSNVNSQFSQSINITRIKRQTSGPVKKSNVTPIYKPQTKVTAKPINKQLAVNYKPKQSVKLKRQLPLQKKVPAIVSASNKPVLVIQQPINKPGVNEVGNLLFDHKQEVIVNTDGIVPPVQAGNQIIINKLKAYASSGGSGGAKKSTQRISSSKRKNINHFRYSTNRKITKLMARTKKNKIDPARCFVWR